PVTSDHGAHRGARGGAFAGVPTNRTDDGTPGRAARRALNAFAPTHRGSRRRGCGLLGDGYGVHASLLLCPDLACARVLVLLRGALSLRWVGDGLLCPYHSTHHEGGKHRDAERELEERHFAFHPRELPLGGHPRFAVHFVGRAPAKLASSCANP